MQWIVTIILSSALLVAARSRTARAGDEFGLEPSREPKEIYDTSRERQLWNPLYDKDLYAFLSQFKEKNEPSATKFPHKRALSALSRWKPLGNLGIRMKAIHRPSARAPMISMVPEMNLVSAESDEGVRPLGQPLRWGRKR